MAHLCTPIKIGNTEIRNRLVLLGMGLGYGENFRVNDRLIRFFTERAAGGVGLIIVGSLLPSNYENAPMTYSPATLALGIWDDSFIPDLKKLTDSVHSYDCKIFAQVSINYEWRANRGQALEVIGPSDNVEITKVLKTRALTKPEIAQIIEEFANAVVRCRNAGFNGVELHFGNGFLIHQFLSPRTNHRQDEYGGSYENRMRLPLKIIEAARQKVGKDYTLTCRFSAEELIPGGLTMQDTIPMVRQLVDAGLDGINAQTGTETTPIPLVQQWVTPGAYVYVAEAIRKAVEVPVITAYRIKDVALAENIVASGRADMVGMARGLLADPELPNKFLTGRSRDIRPCISCCRCLDDIMDSKPVSCSVNARLGKEIDYPDYPLTNNPQKIVVVGGGPAGMEAARVAACLGHIVTLYDRAYRLGGSLLLASVVNEELRPLVSYLSNELAAFPVELKLGKAVNVVEITASEPNVVILAPGGIAQKSGTIADQVLNRHDIFENLTGGRIKDSSRWRRTLWKLAASTFRYFYTPGLFARLANYNFPFGKSVIIVGGGFAGCEIADFLADRGKQVTIIAESNRVGEGIGASTRWVVRNRLKEKTRIIEHAEVEITGAKSIHVVSDDIAEELLADTILLTWPLVENHELESDLRDAGISVVRIGDSAAPGQIKEAIAAGFKTGFEV